MFTPRIPTLLLVTLFAVQTTRTTQAASDGSQLSRLVATPAKIAEVQEAIKVPGSHHQLAYESMKKRVENPDIMAAYQSGIGKYEKSYRAREAALLSLLATDPAAQKKYADIAYESIMTGSQALDSSKGLEPASVGLNIALAYNWLAGIWSPEESGNVRALIVKGIDAWPKFKHVNVSGPMVSNWAGVTRGAELVMIHAAGLQNERKARVEAVTKDILSHIRNGYGSQGVGQEGIGYTEYPGQFLGAAALVSAQSGDTRILEAMREKGWWRLAMYTHTFQKRAFEQGDVKFLLWGVGSRNPDEGWASLLIPTVPEQELPYFLWWYDRSLGALFEGPIDGFDAHRAGTTWSLLLYPTGTASKDPTGHFPPAIEDSSGFYIFRNRWKDADDLQVLAASDRVHHDRAWDQPDVFSLGLIGYNTMFAGSAGKETKNHELYSSLLVDGKYQVGAALTGDTVSFEPDGRGGYLVADGGALYKKLGVDDAKRHTAVHFTAPEINGALISTLDVVKSATSHTYTWQLDPGPPGGGGVAVEVESGTSEGRPSFLMKGDRGSFVKGWVLHPADAKVIAGDPLQVETSGTDAEIWIVMSVGSGQPPTAQISGEGLASVLTLPGASVRFDRSRDKIQIKE